MYQQHHHHQQQRKTRAIQELNYSLSEWGLGLTAQGGKNKAKHDRVRKRIVDALEKMLTETLPEPFSVRDLQSQQFPNQIEDAYKYVLAHDDVHLPCFLCLDTLGGGSPFFRCYDRRDLSKKNRQVTWYQRRLDFKGLYLEDLDPVRRFGYRSIEEEEILFRRWFLQDISSMLGVVMEAAVACHAIHNEACVNCKAGGTLRWKGGSGAAWQDLVCIKCMAIYEVKTKESMEEIQRVVDRNRIGGGSFREACRLENSLLPGQKRYIVFLPRNETSKRMEMVHPVQVAEIKSILPAVSGRAFMPPFPKNHPFFEGIENVELKTFVLLDSNTRQHWFDLPLVETSRPLHMIAKEVFLERFSEEEFNKLKAKYSEEAVDPQSIHGSAILTESERLEKLKIDLAETAGADDWEDLLSDSENDSTSNSPSGQEPNGAKEYELFQKRMKLVVRGAVIVGFSAMVIGVLRQHPS